MNRETNGDASSLPPESGSDPLRPPRFEPHIPKRPSFFRRAAANFAIFFVTVTLLLAGTEILFRTVLLNRLSPTVVTDRPHFFVLPESSHDNRDFAYPIAKAPGTFRVIVIGDSFTFGGKCPFDDTFPKRLERMMRLNNDHRPVEVMNWGVPGLSTRQEDSGIHHAIKYFNPDLIILQVTLNDPELRPLGKHLFSSIPSWIETMDKYWKSGGFVAHRIWNSVSQRRYVQYYFSLYENADTKTNFTVGAQDAINMANEAHVPLVAAIFPVFSHTVDDKYPFAPLHNYIDSLFTTLKINHVDLMDAFRGIPAERLAAIPGKDPHPNEIAHRIAAERIYSFLIEQHVLPQDLIAKRFVAQRPLRGRYPVGSPTGNNVSAEEKALTDSSQVSGDADLFGGE